MDKKPVDREVSSEQASRGQQAGSAPRDSAAKPSRLRRLTTALVACLVLVLVGWYLCRVPLARQGGIWLCGKIGGPTVPILRNALDDPDRDVAATAAEALASVGKGAAPSLIQSFRDGDRTMRLQAARALAILGPDGREAAPVLLEALKDPDPSIRFNATLAVISVGFEADEGLPHLIPALTDRDEPVRRHAADAIATLGPAGAPAAAALEEAVRKNPQGSWPRNEFQEALDRVRPKPAATAPGRAPAAG